MPVDKDLSSDPKALAATIRARLQPGNDPRFPWVPFDLTHAEWEVLCRGAEALPTP